MKRKLFYGVLVCLLVLLVGCGEPSEEALQVTNLIDGIGEVTINSGEKIEQAEQAYSELTQSNQTDVKNINKLREARNAYDALVVKQLIKLIDGIGEITLETGEKIDQIDQAYNKLDQANQAKVVNYDKLTEVRSAYGKIAVADVIKKITAIGKVTEESKEKIDIAEQAFDKLTDNQKSMVSNKKALEEAKKTYKKIEDGTYVPEVKKPVSNSNTSQGTVVTVAPSELEFRYEIDYATGNKKDEKRVVKVFTKNKSDKIVTSATLYVNFLDQTKKHPLGSETFAMDNINPGQEVWGVMEIKTNYQPGEPEVIYSNIKAKAIESSNNKTVNNALTEWLKEEYEMNFMDADWYKEIVSIEAYTDKTVKVVTSGTDTSKANVIYWLQDKSHYIKQVDLYDKNGKLLASYTGKN